MIFHRGHRTAKRVGVPARFFVLAVVTLAVINRSVLSYLSSAKLTSDRWGLRFHRKGVLACRYPRYLWRLTYLPTTTTEDGVLCWSRKR
ncbi:hypothetical protein GE09DRAFT_1146670 [Coniochaeta sp. 2T2.1]|nr:hypothetical protein GE09DRAFT_1146670 [Coniochaeta sp. 2T2.1]